MQQSGLLLDEDPVALVRKRFSISEDFQGDFLTRCDRYYNLYRAKPDQSQYRIVTRAQYVVPICYKVVETILPRIIAVIFSADPPVQSSWRISPPDDPMIQDPLLQNHELKLRMIDQLFKYIIDNNGLFWTVEAWIKESLIYGQAYVKVGWKHQKRVTKTPQPSGEQTSEENIVDEVDVKNVEIRDLFFSPEATFPNVFESAKYVIHRSQNRLSNVVALRDAGIYQDFDEGSLRPDYEYETAQDKKGQAIGRSYEAMPDSDDPMITIYECWEDDRVITTANHRILLRDEPNPFKIPGYPPRKPFVACYDNLMVGELFQVGEVEPLEMTQIEMSTLRRQRTDNNSLIINHMFIYNKNAEVDLESMTLARPGGGVGCVPPAGEGVQSVLSPIPQGDLNGASFKEFQDLNQDAQDISGLVDYAVGTAPERRETATTVQLLQTAANQRFDLKVRNYNRSVKELFEMIYEREKQLQSKPIPVKVPIPGQLGFVFKNISKDDLPDYCDVDLNLPGSPAMLMKDMRRQKMLQDITTMQSIPTINPMAVHKMFMLYLKESDLDGIEPILALLEQPQPPPMPPGQTQPGATPPSPPSPPPFPGVPQLNENPMIPLMPRPSH